MLTCSKVTELAGELGFSGSKVHALSMSHSPLTYLAINHIPSFTKGH